MGGKEKSGNNHIINSYVKPGVWAILLLVIGMLLNSTMPLYTSWIQKALNPSPDLQVIPVIWRQTVSPYTANSFTLILENAGQGPVSNLFMYLSFNTKIVNGTYSGDMNLTMNNLAVLGDKNGDNYTDISVSNIEPGQVECFYFQFNNTNPIIYNPHNTITIPTVPNFSRFNAYVTYGQISYRLPKQNITGLIYNYTTFNAMRFAQCTYVPR